MLDRSRTSALEACAYECRNEFAPFPPSFFPSLRDPFPLSFFSFFSDIMRRRIAKAAPHSQAVVPDDAVSVHDRARVRAATRSLLSAKAGRKEGCGQRTVFILPAFRRPAPGQGVRGFFVLDRVSALSVPPPPPLLVLIHCERADRAVFRGRALVTSSSSSSSWSSSSSSS